MPRAARAGEILRAGDVVALLGRSLTDREGQEIGRIVDVLTGPDGRPRAVVADIGGFLGMGARHIAIAWALLRFQPGKDGWLVAVDAPAASVAAAPEYGGDGADVPVLSAQP